MLGSPIRESSILGARIHRRFIGACYNCHSLGHHREVRRFSGQASGGRRGCETAHFGTGNDGGGGPVGQRGCAGHHQRDPDDGMRREPEIHVGALVGMTTSGRSWTPGFARYEHPLPLLLGHPHRAHGLPDRCPLRSRRTSKSRSMSPSSQGKNLSSLHGTLDITTADFIRRPQDGIRHSGGQIRRRRRPLEHHRRRSCPACHQLDEPDVGKGE